MKLYIVSCLIFLILGTEAGLTSDASSSNNALLQMVINTWAYTGATDEAWHALSRGSSPVDAIEAGLTSCEMQQCGKEVGFGGSPDENGETTLDAMLMDGNTMDVGAVAALRRIKTAAKVAKYVLRYTNHSLLVGSQATAFAVNMGFKEQSLTTNESFTQWTDWKRNHCQSNFWRDVAPDPRVSCGPYHPPVNPSFALNNFNSNNNDNNNFNNNNNFNVNNNDNSNENNNDNNNDNHNHNANRFNQFNSNNNDNNNFNSNNNDNNNENNNDNHNHFANRFNQFNSNNDNNNENNNDNNNDNYNHNANRFNQFNSNNNDNNNENINDNNNDNHNHYAYRFNQFSSNNDNNNENNNYNYNDNHNHNAKRFNQFNSNNNDNNNENNNYNNNDNHNHNSNNNDNNNENNNDNDNHNANRFSRDTITMIAMDGKGRVAAGSSTNGLNNKIPGRVGDSPIPGAGAYADATVGGAAATGDGDKMMRFLPSFYAVEEMRRGTHPAEAAKMAINRIKKYYGHFYGAVIAANIRGEFGAACSGMKTFPYSVANNANGYARTHLVNCLLE